MKRPIIKTYQDLIAYGKKYNYEVTETVPKGFAILEGTLTEPRGTRWISNRKSRLHGERKIMLVMEENIIEK